jgi:hypothetical protein
MRMNFALAAVLTLGAFTLPARVALAANEGILGKWSITLDTPETPLTIEVEFKKSQTGSITGNVTGSVAPVPNLRFNDPYLEFVISARDAQFLLKGVLKQGALTGRWEQVGKSNSGYWNGVQRSPASVSANDHLEGSWHLIVKIPQNDQSFELRFERQGDSIAGFIGWSGGPVVPIPEVTFKDDKLTLVLNIFDNSYRFEGTLKEGLLSGYWYARGPFIATRKPQQEK